MQFYLIASIVQFRQHQISATEFDANLLAELYLSKCLNILGPPLPALNTDINKLCFSSEGSEALLNFYRSQGDRGRYIQALWNIL